MSSVLECRNVSKVFRDGERKLTVLQGVNLKIAAGQVLAITGASGAGKSTLLHIVGTLDSPTDGEVLFEGRPLSSLSRTEINRVRNKEIGFVFQFYHLLPEFTALENVMMPGLVHGARRSQCRERAEEILAMAGLKDRLTHKPGQLSGGEQQRVAIARALFNRPRIILADEPTGNLDERTGQDIMDLLWELNASEKVTLVIVSHDHSLAARADRWVELHEGTAVER